MIERFIPREEFSSYEDFKANFQLTIPEDFNFAYDVVDAWALEEPNKKAMLWTDDEGKRFDFTFADFKKCLFCLPHCIEHFTQFFVYCVFQSDTYCFRINQLLLFSFIISTTEVFSKLKTQLLTHLQKA